MPCREIAGRARNEIRHCRDGLNPVITGLNCPASAGQCFSPTNRHLADKEGAGSRMVLIMQPPVKSLGHMCLFAAVSEKMAYSENNLFLCTNVGTMRAYHIANHMKT